MVALRKDDFDIISSFFKDFHLLNESEKIYNQDLNVLLVKYEIYFKLISNYIDDNQVLYINEELPFPSLNLVDERNINIYE